MKKLIIILSGFLFLLELSAQTIDQVTDEVYLNFKHEAPLLAWETPTASIDTVSKVRIDVRVGIISQSQLTDYNVILNDKLIAKSRSNNVVIGDKSRHNYDVLIDQKVTLISGMNTIGVNARNSKGKSIIEEKKVFVILPQELITAATRKDYALVFGIDKYDEWTPLNNPVHDASTIAEELNDNYDFDVELVKNPTKNEILLKIREYFNKDFKRDDQLFIFFAGHGQFDEITKNGYLVTKDSKRNDPTFETYISHANLRQTIDNIPSDHIFIAMDACFGGTFDPVIASAGERGVDNAYTQSAIEFIQRKLRFKTRKYLTSGGKVYVSDGIPGKHSPFASAFLDALRSYGGGNDNILTLTELQVRMEKLKQQPRFGSFGINDEPGSDFIFVAR